MKDKFKKKIEKIKKNINIKNIIILTIVLAIIIVLCILAMPFFQKITTPEGQANFKKAIENLGGWGFTILFAMELLQIVVPFLPGEPIELLAGVCYGAWGGMAFLMISVFITTAIIFFLVKKFGRSFVAKFVNENTLKKIEKNEVLNNSKAVESILLILFVVPGLPKDIIVYIGGLLPIKPLRFLLITTFGRFPSIISSTLVGANAISGDWKSVVIIYAVTFALAVLVVVGINLFDKDNKTKSAIKAIK